MNNKEVKINTLDGYELFDGYTIDVNGNVYSYYIRGMNRKYTGINWEKEPTKLRPTKKSNGYLHLGMSDANGKTKYPTIHRLLALAFIRNDNKGTVVNHINGNKLDNRLENLEWVSHKRNTTHAFEIGNMHKFDNGMNKPVDQFDLYGNYISSYESIADAVKHLRFKPSSKSAISRACKGKQKTSGGFIWKFSNSAKGSTTISKESTP